MFKKKYFIKPLLMIAVFALKKNYKVVVGDNDICLIVIYVTQTN